MSDISANDNLPAETLDLHVEIAHAVNALQAYELSVGKKMIMVPLPNGTIKPLGEILMRLGQALLDKKNAEEERRPRIVMPRLLRP